MVLRAILILSLFVIKFMQIPHYDIIKLCVLTDFPLGNSRQTGEREVVVTVDGRLDSLTLVYR